MYIFTIIAFVWFSDDFKLPVDKLLPLSEEKQSCPAKSYPYSSGVVKEMEDKEQFCETFFLCLITVLNQGVRSGGGIGDVMRRPSSQVMFCRQHLI